MLNQVCQYLRNYFDTDSQHNRLPHWSGEITIADGQLVGFSNRLLVGQYFRVIDSILNDGVYQYGADTLKDEIFTGTVQSMKIPPDLVALDEEITAWITANKSAINSPYASESFGGYSYSLKNSGGDSDGVTWQSQFAARLAPWRKI